MKGVAVDLMARTERVKRHARTLGFDACGVAVAGGADEEDRLGAWLERGYHADMAWLAESKAVRQDVRAKLAGTASVVVVARNYYAPGPDAPEGAGRVARYAWGRDYHRVLRKPLARLAQFIATHEPGAETYCSIDTGPVLEKAWAIRAGIGWLGKNSLVVRPDIGSWFVLGVILTTVGLEPDAPCPDRCGDCTRCLDACPTGALVAPYTVDARRCISYLTVENNGPIPDELAPLMRDWVFGCDACQEACPLNDGPPVTSEPDFHPRPGAAYPNRNTLEAMDDEAFTTVFAGTAMMRAKRAGMLRNVRAAGEKETKTSS